MLESNQKPDKYFYTNKYLREQQVLDYVKKQEPKSYKNYIILFSILIVLIGIGYCLTTYDEKKFDENSIVTKAVVDNIIYKNQLVNQFEGTRLSNYTFEYRYFVNGNEVKSFYIVDEFEYSKFFVKTVKEGDTILIKYNMSNPEISKIKSLD